MANPEKPKQETIRIGDREIPVTHEDIDLKEFTRRINEAEPVQTTGEEETTREKHFEEEAAKLRGKELEEAEMGAVKPYPEDIEKVRQEVEKAYEKESKSDQYVSENLIRITAEKEKDLEEKIKGMRAEGGQTLNTGEKEAIEKDVLLKELGYSLKYEGGLRGGLRGFLTGKEKVRVLKEGKPIEKDGKPLEFKANWWWHYPGKELLGFLKSEFQNKTIENLKKEWEEKNKETSEKVSPASQEKEVETPTGQVVEEGDLLARMKKEGQITERTERVGKSRVEASPQRPEVGGKKEKKEKKIKEAWKGIDFAKMEREGVLGKMKEMNLDNNTKDIIGIIKKYGQEISLPVWIEKLARQYDQQKPEEHKFEKAKDNPKSLKEWVAGFLTELEYPERIKKLREVKLGVEKKPASAEATASKEEKPTETVTVEVELPGDKQKTTPETETEEKDKDDEWVERTLKDAEENIEKGNSVNGMTMKLLSGWLVEHKVNKKVVDMMTPEAIVKRAREVWEKEKMKAGGNN